MSWPGSGPVGLKAEAVLSSAWSDLTASLLGGSPAVITRPRSAEQGKFATSTAAVTLDGGTTGAWTPGGPSAPSDWGLGTPLRLSVPAPGTYLRLDGPGGIPASPQYATTPDASALHVTGSLELRVQLRLADWRPTVLAARWGASGTPSWIWGILTDGTLQFGWYDSGGTQHVVTTSPRVPFNPGTFALRVTFNSANGQVQQFVAASIDGSYAPVDGAVSGTGGAATSLRAGDQPLTAGWSGYGGVMGQLCGQVDAFRMYNGIGGTVVANPVFSAQSAGTSSFTDSASRSWSVTGGAGITDRDYRFWGSLTQASPAWVTASGGGFSVPVQASGVLAQLQGATLPARSSVRRYYAQLAGSPVPVALWPLESGAETAQTAEVISGSPANALAFIPVSSDGASFPGCMPLAVFDQGYGSFAVPSYTPGAYSVVRLLADVKSVTATDSVMMSVMLSNGSTELQVLLNAAGQIRLRTISGGSLDTGYLSYGPSVIGRPALYSVELSLSGSTIQVRFVVYSPGVSTNVIGPTSTGVTGTTRVIQGTLSDTGCAFTGGFLSVQTGSAYPDVTALASPLAGWAGETPGTRFARLCTENGVWPRVIGSPDAESVLMGAQPAATLTDLWQECEDAGGGVVFEPRGTSGLAYRTRAVTGQSVFAAVPAVKGYLGDGSARLAPRLNNSFTQNDVTVTRQDGSGIAGGTSRKVLADGSPMSVAPTGRPPNSWPAKANVNLKDDSYLAANAAWRLARGTSGEVRWPQLPFTLTLPALSSLVPTLRQLDIGDELTVTTMPDGFAALDQLAWGLTETIGHRGGTGWDIAVNTVPAAPWA